MHRGSSGMRLRTFKFDGASSPAAAAAAVPAPVPLVLNVHVHSPISAEVVSLGIMDRLLVFLLLVHLSVDLLDQLRRHLIGPQHAASQKHPEENVQRWPLLVRATL